jgi:DNA-binding response OmpR family regulator
VAVPPHILVVDDEPDIRGSIEDYLVLHGLSVATAEGGAAMRARLEEAEPALVVLDLNMPGEDGLSLARWLRENHRAGILMLTAMAEPMDRVIGLELGADDYMAKPFHLRELLARIRSILRRAAPDPAAARSPAVTGQAADGSETVRFGRCVLHLPSGTLRSKDGPEEQLTAMELDLLRAFAAHPNRILSRDRLLELAHNRSWDPFDRSIDVRITRIRKKIEPDPARPRTIRTVRGAGYVFKPDG